MKRILNVLTLAYTNLHTYEFFIDDYYQQFLSLIRKTRRRTYELNWAVGLASRSSRFTTEQSIRGIYAARRDKLLPTQ
jgi:hypothetical protein